MLLLLSFPNKYITVVTPFLHPLQLITGLTPRFNFDLPLLTVSRIPFSLLLLGSSPKK